MSTYSISLETNTATIFCGERKAKSAENALRAQAKMDGRKITEIKVDGDYTLAVLENGSQFSTKTN